MTETLVAVTTLENAEHKAAVAAIEVPVGREVDELEVARELVRQARDAGVALTGPDGLLKAITKTVIETALDEELSEHLAMTSMIVRVMEVVTRATEPVPRRCLRMRAVPSISRCRATEVAHLSPRSSRNANAG
jgi:hypothetical protein